MRNVVIICILMLLSACSEERPESTTGNDAYSPPASTPNVPEKLAGILEIGDIQDTAGEDVLIFGAIHSGETAVLIELKGSMLSAAGGNDGDRVEVVIDEGMTGSGVRTHRVLEIRILDSQGQEMGVR